MHRNKVFSLFDPTSKALQDLLEGRFDRLLWAFIDHGDDGPRIVFDAVIIGESIPKPHLDAMRVTIVDRKRRWRFPIVSPARFEDDEDGERHLRGRTTSVHALPLLSRDATITLTVGERDLLKEARWHALRREMERRQKG